MEDLLYEHDQDLASQADIEVLLPVIRRSLAVSSIAADYLDDVLAIYPDRVVLLTMGSRIPVPDAAFDPAGSEALLQVESVGPIFIAAWDEIASVEWSGTKKYGNLLKLNRDFGREIRFRLADGRQARCFLPEEEAAMAIIAFERMLPGKAQSRKKLGRFSPGRPRLRRREWSPHLWLTYLIISLIILVIWGVWHDEVGFFSDLQYIYPVVALCVVGLWWNYVWIHRLRRPGCSASFKQRRRDFRRRKSGKRSARVAGRQPLRMWWTGLVLKIIGGAFLMCGFFAAGFDPAIDLMSVRSDELRNLREIKSTSNLCYIGAALFVWAGYRLMLRPATYALSSSGARLFICVRSLTIAGIISTRTRS